MPLIFLATMGFLFATTASNASPNPSISPVVAAALVTDKVPICKGTTAGMGAGLVAAAAVFVVVVAAAALAAAVKTVVGMAALASPAVLTSPDDDALPLMDVIISSNAFEESQDFTVTFFPSSASSLLRLSKIDTPGL